MKKLILFLAIGSFTSSVNAQDLPKPSPLSKVEQVVGLTEFSIEYSRPSAKDRDIFGKLVAYDKLWRLGANSCTKFTTSTDVVISGTTIKPGTYSMFATPSKSGEWTIDFNTNSEQSGTSDYDATKNVVSAKVKSLKNSFTETLTIGFDNLTANSGIISIKWENLRVDVPFTVNTSAVAEKNITDAIAKGENLGNVYYNAASYFSADKDKTKANMYLDKSIAVEKNHKNTFMKARMAKEVGNTAEAITLAKEALALAEKAEHKGWASYIASTIQEWSK